MQLVVYLLAAIFAANGSRTRAPINLYEGEPSVLALDGSNFDRHVYNSSQAHLVEFYAHWCGACKKIKAKILELARRSQRWHHNLIRVVVVNCGDVAFNEALCSRHEIGIYPTLKFFGPKMPANKHGQSVQVDTVENMLERMVDFVQENFEIPNLKDFTSKKIELIFGSNKNAKYAILVIEDPNSYLGKKLILDFLDSQNRVVIRRTTFETNPALISKLHWSDRSNLPKIYIVDRAKNTSEIFDYTVLKKLRPDISSDELENNPNGNDPRSKLVLMIEKLIENSADDEENEQIDISTLNNGIKETASTDNDEIGLNNIMDKVYMQDLESGLHLMIRSDISHSGVISGPKMAALKEWIRILAKYFPGRDVVKNYLKNLSTKLNQKNEINGNDWKALADEKTDDSYLPDTIEWYHCRGSKPEFRGYPCSLWTLFHVLTVAQLNQEYSKSNPFEDFKIREVIEGIQLFVKYLFTCKECSDNFARETHDYTSHLKKPTDAILYLWKVHNKVNRRLSNEKGNEQDPKFPKLLFPTKNQCPKCHVESVETSNRAAWNIKEVTNYLTKYYSSSNLIPVEETSTEQPLLFIDKQEQEISSATTSKIYSVLEDVFSMRNESAPSLFSINRFVYLIIGTVVLFLLV